MPKPVPIYRTDHVACPLNAGKLLRVVTLIGTMRAVANREAQLQWKLFYQGRYGAFEKTATADWTRAWVESGEISVTHAQMIMAQVAGGLEGFIGNVQNTYTSLVSGCSSPSITPAVRHQLHAINRAKAWMSSGPFFMQPVSHEDPVEVSSEVRALARKLIRRALHHHRKPRWKNFAPAIDQRAVTLAVTRPKTGISSQFEVWARLSLLPGEKPIELPVALNAQIKGRQKKLKEALVCASARGERNTADADEGLAHTSQDKLPDAGKVKSKPIRRVGHASLRKEKSAKPRQPRDKNSERAIKLRALKEASRAALHEIIHVPQTLRLLLSDDKKSLQLALYTDCRPQFAHDKATYKPRTNEMALDLGLRTLFATDRGDLLGRHWMTQLERYDERLTRYARHRQRIGLKVSSQRYQALVQAMRGFIKSEVNRIFNRLVAVHAPAHLILEALNFQNKNLSRRLNRLIGNFGKGLIQGKLKSLEERYGITHEFRESAYTSQECSACDYVDKRNRTSQSEFSCRWCHHRIHADVNASRVLQHQRLVPVPFMGTKFRIQRILRERTQAFLERYPRPRGGPADPRFSNPYFTEWRNLGEVTGEGCSSPSFRTRVRATTVDQHATRT